jgi:AcrR family transcriptional regulator
MTDIIEASGLPEASVYFHFPTVEAVALALVESQAQRWSQLVDAAAQRHEQGRVSALEAIVGISFAMVRHLRDDVLSRAGVRLAHEGRPLDTALPDPFAAWTAQTAALLDVARAEGAVGGDPDTAVVSEVLVFACYGVHQVTGPAGERATEVQLRLAELWRLLLGGLCPASTDIDRVVTRGRRLAKELWPSQPVPGAMSAA